MRSEPFWESPADSHVGHLMVQASDGQTGDIQEKVNEYRFLVAPVEQAIAEMERVRRMLQARTEDEIHALSPALAALSDALGITTLDLLTARDRAGFLRDAMARKGMTLETLARQVTASGAGAREQWQALGLPSASDTHDETQQEKTV